MDTAVVRVTISLIVPVTILLYGVAFLVVWFLDRQKKHIPMMALACAFFAAGACSQILYIPADTGLNALLSCAFYSAATLLVAEAMLRKYELSFGSAFHLGTFLILMLLIAYFFYIDRDLTARVYIQNFTYGTILLITAFKISPHRKKSFPDAVLFWVLFGFAASFFPRTLITFGFSAPEGARAFGDSVFWQFLQLWMSTLR